MDLLRRLPWALAGLVVGAAGLATSYACALVLTVRQSPVVAVSEWIAANTPGPLVHWAINTFGHHDKTVLKVGIVVVVGLVFCVIGLLHRTRPWAAYAALLLLAAVGLAAVASRPGFRMLDLVPLAVGLATWFALLPPLSTPLREADGARDEAVGRESRRAFLIRTAAVAGGALAVGVVGRVAGAGRRTVERTRALLRLEGVSAPATPRGVTAGLEGVAPWQTPEKSFYLIDTAFAVPTIEPADWSLRIHGMVERELTISFQDLVERKLTEGWVTLCCVSNPVGGDLVGNAWWSGVRIADLLAEAGVHPDADAVKQTSHDGWTCGTPIEALTDDRNALLAVAMNGKPLPLEHGFPVRSVVPGLYGYVSATKWVVEFEVTRFVDFEAYWTTRGWSVSGPVKIASRIDVPRDGASVPAGPTKVGGVAWFQHTGIEAVQVSVDGGDWQEMTLARTPNVDTWAQWSGSVELAEGEHTLAVRARGADGDWQTADLADVLPDGATGHHTISLTAESE